METQPMNILLITSDQQHYNTIGAFNKEIHTPNLDRLVKEGTYFDRAYCPNPTCTPTRATLITGQYPSQHGAWTLGTKLKEDVPTLGEYLQKQGYRTSLVGKAHFQPIQSTPEYPSLESYPLFHDLEYWKKFDEPFYGFNHVELARNHTSEYLVGQHYALWMEEKGCANWKDYFTAPIGTLDEKLEGAWPIPEAYHYDTWIAERTMEQLQSFKEKNEPFFMWASFFDPHPPYLVPEPWASMYDPETITIPELVEGEHEDSPPFHQLTQEKAPDWSPYMESGFCIHGGHSHVHDKEKLKKQIATYYGMVSMMDHYIGKILDKLEALGLEKNTLVVFTTDHGHFFGHHGLIAKGPFLYEDMIKVPLIVRYPEQVPAGCINTSMQSLVDLAPTFLDFSNMSIPRQMTGLSQKEVWLGTKEQVRDHILCEHHHEPTTVHLNAYVNERYKLVVYYNREWGEIYDLQEDPKEVHNLWDDPAYAELKQQLLLKYIWAQMGKEPMWMPRIWGA